MRAGACARGAPAGAALPRVRTAALPCSPRPAPRRQRAAGSACSAPTWGPQPGARLLPRAAAPADAAAGPDPAATPSGSGAAAAAAAESPEQRRARMLEEARAFLDGELRSLFSPGGEITRSRYAADMRFQDPITNLDSVDGYILMVGALKTLFNIRFELHSLEVTGPQDITARWTMYVDVRVLPWRPDAVFTGRSFYTVDPASGLITSHRDVWDGVVDNSFLSLEGVAYMIRKALDFTQLPRNLETPKYSVLKSTGDYEIRRYEPFIVADAPTAAGGGVSSGGGFNDLARYIFGGNVPQQPMEMTTPVFSEPVDGGSRMSFVMEEKFTDVDALPAPLDPRISRRKLPPRVCAAARFSGLAFDWEVADAERALRGALLRDGLALAMGFRLARYNDPGTPPPLRRNEVLIDLEGFEWP